MATANIKAEITVEDKASSTIESFGQKASRTALGVGAALTAIGVAGVIAGKSLVDAFANQEAVTIKLQAGINNVKTARDKDISALLEQAGALQKVTRFSDEQIISAQGMLTTFQLNQDVIKTLTPSILNMAEGMRRATGETMELDQIALLMGKVMGGAEDGIEGMSTALRKSGVIMTDAQKEVFKYGSSAERAATLTAIMNTNFGGLAEEGGKSFSGRLDILNNQFGELQEKMGGALANAISPFIDKLTNIVTKVDEWSQKNPELVSKLTLLTAGVIAFAGAIGLAALAITAIGAIGGGWVVLIAAGVLAVAGAVAWLVEKFIGWQNVWNGLVNVYNTYIKPALQDLWSTIQTQLLPVLQEFWDKNQNWIIPALQALAIVIGVVILGSILAFIAVLKIVVQAISWLGQGFTWVVEQIKNGIGFIVEKATYLKDHFWEVVGSIVGFFATLPIKMPMYVAQAIMWVVNYIRNIDWGGIWNTIYNALTNMLSKIPSAFMNMINAVRNLDWGGIGKSIANAIMGFMEGAINGAFSGIPGAPKVKLPRFARGVENFGGGLAVVGERGPELVNLPRGSDVIPNNQIGSTSGGSTTININVGLMTGSAIERRDAAMKMFEDLQDIASQRGQTVGQLIGV